MEVDSASQRIERFLEGLRWEVESVEQVKLKKTSYTDI